LSEFNLIPAKTAKPVKKFFSSFNEVILKMIDLIMLAAACGCLLVVSAVVEFL
jgi:Na+/H+-dicarboxylate symporter